MSTVMSIADFMKKCQVFRVTAHNDFLYVSDARHRLKFGLAHDVKVYGLRWLYESLNHTLYQKGESPLTEEEEKIIEDILKRYDNE